MADRQILKEVGSGKIEIIWSGAFSRVEFNCNCADAKPYCNSMCCRMTLGWTVELEPEEKDNYLSRLNPKNLSGKSLIATKPDGMSCYYLDEKGMCSIHERKPSGCRKWHCSSAGEIDDKGIERRDGGWILTPVGGQ